VNFLQFSGRTQKRSFQNPPICDIISKSGIGTRHAFYRLVDEKRLLARAAAALGSITEKRTKTSVDFAGI
jgi:hypothetical protein